MSLCSPACVYDVEQGAEVWQLLLAIVPQEHPLVSDGPDIEEIKARAYELWCERGCPHGSSDEDWHRAERELRAKNGSQRISDKLHESSGSVQR